MSDALPYVDAVRRAIEGDGDLVSAATQLCDFLDPPGYDIGDLVRTGAGVVGRIIEIRLDASNPYLIDLLAPGLWRTRATEDQLTLATCAACGDPLGGDAKYVEDRSGQAWLCGSCADRVNRGADNLSTLLGDD